MEGARDKLLTFTDNRQDASLQSGHFNDFIHVSLLRCALHAALQLDNELAFDRVAEAVVAASGLTVRSVAKNPELDPVSPAADDMMRMFVELNDDRSDSSPAGKLDRVAVRKLTMFCDDKLRLFALSNLDYLKWHIEWEFCSAGRHRIQAELLDFHSSNLPTKATCSATAFPKRDAQSHF